MSAAVAAILIGLVRAYQIGVSPILVALFGARCRFEPSCSRYALESLRMHGPIVGSVRAARRLLRCHPFSAGGYDPP